MTEWLQSPVTKAYFERLKKEAAIRRYTAGSGGFVKGTFYESGEAYVKAMIQAEVYEACSEPSPEDILIGDDEDE